MIQKYVSTRFFITDSGNETKTKYKIQNMILHLTLLIVLNLYVE